MKKNKRRVSVLLNPQTVYQLERFAAIYGKRNLGEVIDLLAKQKALSMREGRF